jgi:hypothetical protein
MAYCGEPDDRDYTDAGSLGSIDRKLDLLLQYIKHLDVKTTEMAKALVSIDKKQADTRNEIVRVSDHFQLLLDSLEMQKGNHSMSTSEPIKKN